MTEPSPRPALVALAERLGILPSYWDIRGRAHATPDATREALAAAMGYDGSTEESARTSLAGLDAEDAANCVEPVCVWRQWEGGAPTLRARPTGGAADYEIELVQEDGRTGRTRGRIEAGDAGRVVDLALPFRPAEGHHRVVLTLSTPAGVGRHEQALILTPRTCFGAEAIDSGPRRFGLVANLYSVRGEAGDGAGDLSDLVALLRVTAAAGGDFVGVSPLHALRNRGLGVSPYSPVSRLYRNPLYLSIEAIPELASCEEARALLASPGVSAERAALRSAARIDYERVSALKRRVLDVLHRCFAHDHRGRDTERGRAFDAYRAREGKALRDFATFCAIEETLGAGKGEVVPFQRWPEGLRDPHSPNVVRFRAEHAGEVAYHAWIQFELDRQLAAAAAAGRDAGMQIGLYPDLAIGLAPDGSDVWAFPGLFATGASVGAPPDDYAPQGQDWGLPPIDPRRLRADGYRYFVRLLRSAFAHAGALRIDHVMGLFRLFWIPSGEPSAAGAYVRYPADDLLGILALESRRHGAFVVGEDLGTVPDEVPRALETWGVLSSRVLLFERDATGGFRPASAYPRRAMVTVDTHDLPTLPAWWDGLDLALRRSLDLLTNDEALALAKRDRHAEVAALEDRLRAEAFLDPGVGEPSTAEVVRASSAFACSTPALLAGLSLDDLAGETEPVNVPGVPLERFPSWSRRMGRTIPALAADPAVKATLAAAARLRPR